MNRRFVTAMPEQRLDHAPRRISTPLASAVAQAAGVIVLFTVLAGCESPSLAPENRAPSFEGDSAFAIARDSILEVTPRVFDPDGTPVRISATELPHGMTFDSVSAVVRWRAEGIPGSTVTFRLTATDAGGLSGSVLCHVMVLDTPMTRRPQWGALGAGAGQFLGYPDLAVAADGLRFLLDRTGKRIECFSAEGTFLRDWSVAAEFGDASAGNQWVAVDSDGRVCLWANPGRIARYSATGTFLDWVAVPAAPPPPYASGPATPKGFAADDRGHFYVVRHRINLPSFNLPSEDIVTRFTPGAGADTTWGKYGLGRVRFVSILTAGPGGSMNLSYSATPGVQVYDATGAQSRSLRCGALSGVDDIAYVNGVGADRNGRIYVLIHDRMVVFNGTDGALITTWNVPEAQGLQLEARAVVAADPEGRFVDLVLGDAPIVRYGFATTE